MLLYRISQALDYFGNPSTYVPTLSLGVITDFIEKSALPTMKTMEDNYNLYLLAR
jgi:hypothetical protein